MKTSKSFATISYNSREFLKGKLDDMFNIGRIEFYAFIYHYAEGDVAGVPELKDHIHLFIIPSETMDTIALKEEFKEFDPTNDLPLSIINCVRSKFYDWFMYSLHDVKYLAAKFEERKYHYSLPDVCCSDFDYLGQLLAMSDNNKLNGSEKFVELCKSGVSFSDLVCGGFIPIHLINQYQYAYNIVHDKLMRDHDCIVTEGERELGSDVQAVDPRHNRKVFNHTGV